MFLSADLIGSAFVTNLSLLGGNITGVSVMRLGGKWPELAKEALPSSPASVISSIRPMRRASPT